MAEMWDNLMQQYPALANQDVSFKNSFGRGPGYLEFWPPGETGDPQLQRPTDFPINKPGVEVFDPKTRPIDVLGDVVSHHMVNIDPNIKSTYNTFVSSLTPDQHQRLQEQYSYAQKNQGEQRPFDMWKQSSGMPAYFRGYAFDQWPHPEEMYTPQQRGMFDSMMSYLRGQPER
jgi:hypothetical protein